MKPRKWKELAAAGKWSSIDWRDLTKKDQIKFRDLLREAVPRAVDENGMERVERYAERGLGS